MRIEEITETAPGVRVSLSDKADIIIIQNADNFGKEDNIRRREAMKRTLEIPFKSRGYVVFFNELSRYVFNPVGEDRRYERLGIIPRTHNEFTLGDYLYSSLRCVFNGNRWRLKDFKGVIVYSEVLADKPRLCDDLLNEILGKEQQLTRYNPH